MSEPDAWDLMWNRGRVSMRARLQRIQSKSWHLGQASVAAGASWWVASDVFHHPSPFVAPIAAVVSLGTSYGQRLRRVAEVTFGVALGVLVADLLVMAIGIGAWQLILIVGLAMTVALMLDAGGLFVTQAAIQSIVVATFIPGADQAFLRWTDALIGGGVALVAATVVPRAPLRRPREQAALVVSKIQELLDGAALGIDSGDVDGTLALLEDARTTEVLIRELREAADEGLSVVRSSPFRRRHRGRVRQVAEVVEPLDLALRNTRVLVRRVAIAAYRHQPIPPAYAAICRDLAGIVAVMAAELRADRMPEVARDPLVQLAHDTSQVERAQALDADVVLAQVRSVIADLLRLTGLGSLQATDAIPPLRTP